MSLSRDYRPVTTLLLLQCLTLIEISLANEEFKMNNIKHGMWSMRMRAAGTDTKCVKTSNILSLLQMILGTKKHSNNI